MPLGTEVLLFLRICGLVYEGIHIPLSYHVLNTFICLQAVNIAAA